LIIVSYEIYLQLHEGFDSIWKIAKKRTIRLCGRSKIERSLVLRFGDCMILDETNEFLTKNILSGRIFASDFKTQFVWLKEPGGNFASFQHMQAVPGLSQILGILEIILVEKKEMSMQGLFREIWINFAIFLKSQG